MSSFKNLYLWSYMPWLIKIVLMFLPLPGYIHPDEFFQSPEIVAGDIFNLKHHRTWEFNPESPPVRSIVPPYLVCGPPYLLLRLAAQFYPKVVTTYTLLIFPRLWILLLVAIIYNAILKHRRLCLQALATSFVVYTFFDRTFSNTAEAGLFIVILEITKTMSKRGGGCTLTKMTHISFVLTLGIFNRPTFIAFAFVPMLRWLLDGLAWKDSHNSVYKFIVKLFVLGCISLSISLVLVTIDSLYYHNDIFSNFSSNKIVIAPLNFALYNTKVENLAQHTLHSRLTHLFINLPQLIGPCVFFYYRDLLYFVKNLSTRHWHRISFHFVVTTFPLVTLSTFPHQELRFLIPLIYPLLFLYGKNIHSKPFVWKIWVLFNLFFGFLYAFFHQGGLVTSISFLNKNTQKSDTHLIYYHTYMPPEHLFVINEKCGTVGFLNDKDRLCEGPKLYVHDLKGASLSSLASTIKGLKKLRNSVYVVAPLTVRMDLPDLNWKQSILFYPHLSMEDLPSGTDFMKCTNGLVLHMECITDILSLFLYEIDLK